MSERKYTRIGLIYGIGGSNALHWQTWLAKKCRKLGIETHYPELPHKDHPVLEEWLLALEKEMPVIDEKTALVGHSLGCPAILHLLERKYIESVGLLVLVAPPTISIIRAGDYSFLLPFYENYNIDVIRAKAKRIELFASDDDIWSEFGEIKGRAGELGANLHVVSGGWHLNVASGHRKFPEILELVK